MKKNRIGLLIATSLLISGSLLIYENYSVFKGERKNDPDNYELIFEAMNKKDYKRFSLKEGDRLHVSFDIKKGRCDLLVNLKEEKIYKGNKIKQADFYLDIEKAGDYEIEFRAKHAKGNIKIEVIRK